MILNKQLALKDNTINVISDIQGYTWLKAKGFETLTSKVNGGETPMYVACQSGNLELANGCLTMELLQIFQKLIILAGYRCMLPVNQEI